MRARRLVGAAVLLAAASSAAAVSAAAGASAASRAESAAGSCSAITISQGRNLTFYVSSVTVNPGGCVRFANLTDVTVDVTVSGSSFSERLPARTPASASASYTARKSATVTATDGVRSGRGQITVERKSGTTVAPAPSPTRSAVVPPPTVGSTTAPPRPASSKTGDPASGGGGGGVSGGVSTEAPAAVNTQYALALPGLPAPPPPASSSAAPATVSHPVVAPRVKASTHSTDPRLTSTVLEPVGGSHRGLPATVAAVLLLGLAAAYGRTVLVAGEAVDRRRAPRPVRPTV
ncbi:MAG TPA: hypothetical protein VHC43_16470 [Mycobacteriales bacterium]|nr:hypothetical protein [Mycobacteriales bacterium]